MFDFHPYGDVWILILNKKDLLWVNVWRSHRLSVPPTQSSVYSPLGTLCEVRNMCLWGIQTALANAVLRHYTRVWCHFPKPIHFLYYKSGRDITLFNKYRTFPEQDCVLRLKVHVVFLFIAPNIFWPKVNIFPIMTFCAISRSRSALVRYQSYSSLVLPCQGFCWSTRLMFYLQPYWTHCLERKRAA